MLMGRRFQSRGAAARKDRSPMVAFVKRFGVLRRNGIALIEEELQKASYFLGYCAREPSYIMWAVAKN